MKHPRTARCCGALAERPTLVQSSLDYIIQMYTVVAMDDGVSMNATGN